MDTNITGKRVARIMVNALDKAINVVVAVVLALMLAVGCYDWWDSQIVDHAASAERWRPYKPLAGASLGFDELRQINPDVVGWLELYGTGVDYPVCYTEDAGYYLGHDALGDDSLVGSLFLDRHNSPDFTDFVSIVYGHHMQADRMFGPLTNFEQPAYFDEHEYGNLHCQGQDRGLDIFACVRADAYDTTLFRTGQSSAAERDEQVQAWMRETLASRQADLDDDDRVLVMSTCSDDKTNARTTVLAKVCDSTFANPFASSSNQGSGVDGAMRILGLPWYGWAAMLALIVLAAALVVASMRRNRFSDATAGEGPGDAR